MKICQWDIVISGFRQQRGADNGSDLLWSQLRQFQSPYRELLLYEWHDDMEELANRLYRHSDRDVPPTIRVYAYSWGGGYAFPRLARALQYYNMSVHIAVLCDAVYRSPFLPWWIPANILSLTSLPTIEIPRNVREVYWLRQRISMPKGHTLRAEDSEKTIIHAPSVLNRPHIGADSSETYHNMALVAAQTPIVRSESLIQKVSCNEE